MVLYDEFMDIFRSKAKWNYYQGGSIDEGMFYDSDKAEQFIRGY